MIGAMAEQRPGSPEVTDQGSSTGGLSRTTTVLALVLAVVFVGAVLAGAKILVDRNVYTDISMGPVDAPDADSPACDAVIGALPDRTSDYRSVGITDPAPAGAAAYRDSGGAELTVRCGVSVPAQYSVVSPVVSHGGTDWLRVDDATAGSDLSTWYSVSSTPVVAVTGSSAPDTALDSTVSFDGFGRAIADNADASEDAAPTPRELPLTNLPADRGAASCTDFENALPDAFGAHRRITETTAGEPIDGVAVWTEPGAEPVVVRCGVGMPESYAAGAQLTQVDDVPWYEDSALGNGSTAGVWYALGYGATVAVSLPLDVGDTVLPQLSGIITDTMVKTGE
jgi:hypothetical protein